MGNKKQLWALAVFLTIPVIMVAGGALSFAIDPEKLAGHTNYVRNFNLLQIARGAVMLAMMGMAVLAWFAACMLVLAAKNQSYRWLALALLGPIGFVVLASLPDLSDPPSDLYARFDRKLRVFWRVAYEAGFFVLGWNVAWQMMNIKREIMIAVQSRMTGLSKEQVMDQQNMQSAMWAVSELYEVMVFLVLLYLLRPVVVNAVGGLLKARGRAGDPAA